MPTLTKLESYKLFYAQFPGPRQMGEATKRKPGPKPRVPQLPKNILENLGSVDL